jgi:pyrroline-5-carboxylate reductase
MVTNLGGPFMLADLQVGFIGGGNMGEALIKGLIEASLVSSHQVHVYDVSGPRMDHLRRTYEIDLKESVGELARASKVIVLAVKPQVMSAVLHELGDHLAHAPLIISIAAGISMTTLTKGLPAGASVVRVMPNTPALVLEGASALARGAHVTGEQMQLALSLFRAVGTAIEVEEKWMDAVTGLSGSGPAYVLLVLESLIDAGVLMGLPRPTARELVLQTVSGTVRMVRETGKHPGELKDLITSPGGTTIHGLQVLEERAVRGAVMRAVEAATLRSHALGKS